MLGDFGHCERTLTFSLSQQDAESIGLLGVFKAVHSPNLSLLIRVHAIFASLVQSRDSSREVVEDKLVQKWTNPEESRCYGNSRFDVNDARDLRSTLR